MDLETPHRLNTVAGRRLSSRSGPGIEYIGARPWQPGDRRIDVRNTVRTGELHARVYAREYAEYALVIADGDARQEWGYPDSQKLKSELVQATADGIGHLLTWQDDHTGMLFAGNRMQHLPIARHSARTLRSFMTSVVPGDTSTLGNALQATIAMNRPQPTLVIVISDFFGDGWQTPFQMLSRRCSVVPVQVTDPWDFNVPSVAGRQVIGGKRYNFGNARTRSEYANAAEEIQLSVNSVFSSSGVTPLRLTTEEGLLDQLRKQIRRDERPARRHYVA
jgi:uncharacterized protein (DUF58 family)